MYRMIKWSTLDLTTGLIKPDSNDMTSVIFLFKTELKVYLNTSEWSKSIILINTHYVKT